MQAQTISEPANIEAEESLLSSVLIGGSEVLQAIDPPVRPEDFYKESHRNLWRALQVVEHPDDYLSISEAAKAAGWRYEITEHARLASVQMTAMYADHYAGIVREMAARRRLIAAGQAIVKAAYGTDSSAGDVYRDGLARLEAAALPETSTAMLDWDDSFNAYARWQFERMQARGNKRLTLPWKALGWVRPLRAGTLAITAANSGIGKTVFAECCADWWAMNGFQVAFFHYELAHQIMLDRRMCRWSGESMEVIESGEMTQRMMDADDVLRKWTGKIHFISCDGWPMPRIASMARNLVRRGKAHVVIVDYLQKAPMVERVRGQNTAQMRGADAETLKSLAEQEQIPVLALSQINREGASADRKTRHQLRDSGELDEKANLVITLDREILKVDTTFGDLTFKAGSYSPKVRVRVDKQTLGGTGEEELIMNPARFTIADIERRQLA